MFYTNFTKLFLDRFVAAGGIIFLSPILLLISIINFAYYGNVFFIQERSGKGLQSFKLLKFQTMKEDSSAFISDIERTTSYGKLLRITSLDELPQLFLVLIGRMSLIGPRPLLVEYNQYYSEPQLKRFTVKPGITGWAQVNGRNKITWERRFELDIYYVENVSIRLDMRILVKTFFQLLKYSEINESENQTMKPFKK
ncbi:sugar transferase [uncultured Cytophaga sp.]|uniref:sugar transferase n=1 Tax=uncultured Cytophaga sp. TaxID=160238 RepID=UPI002637CEF4|nr:sugar transferase [uncultured Cytophaga sp.]